MQAPAFANASPDCATEGTIAQRHLRLGLELYGEGKAKEAIAAFQEGLAAAETAAPGAESSDTVSELHAKLGDAAASCGDVQLAAINA